MLSGGVDVAVGVVDGFGQGHCCPGADTLVVCVDVERVGEVFDRSSKAEYVWGGGIAGGEAVDGGGDFWLVGPVEEHSQAGEGVAEAGDVTGLVERVEARSEQVEGPVEIAVKGFEPG